MKRVLLIKLTSLVILTLLFYGWLLLMRPPRTFQQQQLFQGIVYQRIPRDLPRPLMIHVVSIDLTAKGLDFFVTQGELASDGTEIEAQTTGDFLAKYQLQLAINGSFFNHFYENNAFDYFPKTGDRINILGQAVSTGKTYSQPQSGFPVLCFLSSSRVTIESESCSIETQQALSGREIFIKDGKPAEYDNKRDHDDLFPRTAVAIDKSGEKLSLILIDGRQPYYSEGVTLPELTDIVMELGIDKAINIDGGGSTTLVIADGQKVHLLNSPIHTRLPGRQRPVANHLGVFAESFN